MKENFFLCSVLFIIILFLSSCERKEESSQKTESNTQTKIGNNIVLAPGVESFRLISTDETPAIYQWYCASCHGIEGEGNGINASGMSVRPINHTDPGVMSKKSDRDLFQAILKGGLAIGRAPCMPPWENTLERQTIASLVGYLREICNCEFITS